MTREVFIGKKAIGKQNKIAVQSMTNTATRDVQKTVQQILQLEEAGCDIVRVAVLDESDAQAIARIKEQIHIPIVADIHFDFKLAISALRSGADKVRINPGNIGSEQNVREIIAVAKKKNAAIRIGVNGGSLDKKIEKKYGRTAEAMVKSILKHLAVFEQEGFSNVVLSVKSSNVEETIEANRMLSSLTDYPLHVGVTESGSGEIAKIKSTIGVGTLLRENIGDTIRISLTDHPVSEVLFGHNLLRATGKEEYCEVISCPTCGRCQYDMIDMAKEISEYVKDISVPLKIAVMGCVVNGPGEAKDAHLGIAGGDSKAAIFKDGKVFLTVGFDEALERFKDEIDKLVGRV